MKSETFLKASAHSVGQNAANKTWPIVLGRLNKHALCFLCFLSLFQQNSADLCHITHFKVKYLVALDTAVLYARIILSSLKAGHCLNALSIGQHKDIHVVLNELTMHEIAPANHFLGFLYMLPFTLYDY